MRSPRRAHDRTLVPVHGGERDIGERLGSGKSEKNLFTWFAARPLAQAKAAVVTSLLPWPDDEMRTAPPSGPGPPSNDG